MKRRKSDTTKKPSSAPDSALAHDLQVHKIELELQNEELLTARHETALALLSSREVFELAPIGHAMLEDVDTIADINSAAVQLLGDSAPR